MNKKSGQDRFNLCKEELPKTIPVFPLPGALLLPRGHLPLNIFEPRYLNMVFDALESPSRLIGMIQPLDGESMCDETPLYTTGCAGRITSFTETEDKRVLISLTGLCRFDIEGGQMAHGGYRLVNARWDRFCSDLKPAPQIDWDREKLFTCLKKYFQIHNMAVDLDMVRQSSDEALVTSLSMVCPFDYKEQQALLEAVSIQERAEMIQTLIGMAIQRTCKDKSSCTH